MECQDVRQLLAFLERKSEELDAAEGAALQKHLDACPDCAALTAAERSADQAIGAALRDVAVPARLKQQVLTRLAAERGVAPWKRWAGVAAAAMLLVAIGGGTWAYWPKPEFTIQQDNRTWTHDEVEGYLADQGFPAKAPGKLKYDLLRQVDVILIKGRPVAKLIFVHNNGVDSATVYIVDTKHLSLKLDGDPSIRPLDPEDGSRFSYIIHGRANDDWLMHPVQ